jgi:hypothetical protein
MAKFRGCRSTGCSPRRSSCRNQGQLVQPRPLQGSFRNPYATRQPLRPLTSKGNPANRTLLSQSRPVQPRLPLRSFRNPNAAPLRSLAPQGKPANRTLLSQQTTRPAKPSPGIF